MLALGGASWPRLGSDGGWVAALAEAGVTVTPLQPANCGFCVRWSEPFRSRRAGAPLKRIAASFGERTVRGEAVITADGIEGGAIYALSAALREAIALDGEAVLPIDLRPDVAEAELAAHIAGGRKKESLSTLLRKTAKLSAAAIDLLRESAAHSGIRLRDLPPREIARLIKAVPVHLTGIAGIARAISTAGGVSFDESTKISCRAGSRGLRCRGNARLGGPDRRLSPPGVVCHRSCCRRGRHRVDGTE